MVYDVFCKALLDTLRENGKLQMAGLLEALTSHTLSGTINHTQASSIW